jgi:aryl-alcohol dehydrogenase-like predicted oxidoreductase
VYEQGLVDSGKVRNIGVSNETPYGIMKFCEHAEWDELPKIQRYTLHIIYTSKFEH